MNDPVFESAQCYICDEVIKGRFASPVIFCHRHQRDEVDLHQSMPEKPSKADKALAREYAKRWKGGAI